MLATLAGVQRGLRLIDHVPELWGLAELYLGNYSVHTSAEALRRGQAEIRRIGERRLAP
jgi:hypothetical protein